MTAWLGTLTVVGIVVLAVLLWMLLRARMRDHLDEIVRKRTAGASIVTRADYVEGLNHMPVVLSLAGDTFYYENADLEASFELARIDEVEYVDELATGVSVAAGQRVLRLRSHGAIFEFVMAAAEADRWRALVPGRQFGDVARAV